MRKVFLDDLPRYEEGRYKGKINWKESIGCRPIKFIYDDIEGEIEIIDYIKNGQQLNIKYNNNIFLIRTNNLLKCKLGVFLGVFIKTYKYNVGDIIETNNSNIEILEQIRTSNKNGTTKRSYKYKCLNCNNYDIISETSIIKNRGCNVCCIPSKKVLIGYNDLWTSAITIAKLLKNPEEGYKLTRSSGESCIFVCPDCGYERSIRIYSVFANGYSCIRCGDGISYPNKFAFNLLEQLNVDFIPEYKFFDYRFDFYFELNDKKYNLEMDGGIGHGNENTLTNKTAEETQEIDDYKDKLAKEHNIEVIRINCRNSDLEYIKNNILHSKLSELFDLSNIKWDDIEKFALSSRVKEVCELWNNGIKSTREIKNITKLGDTTIVRYLKFGKIIGMCDYDPTVSKNNLDTKYKRSIIQLTLEGEFIRYWNSIIDATKELNIKQGNIISCCQNKYKYAGGFNWMYKEDYEVCDVIDGVKHRKRKVIQLSLTNEFIKEWNGVNEVQKTLGIHNVSQCCKGERKFSNGFKWMYKEDYENNILFNNIGNNINNKIIQLSLTNDFISEYESVSVAKRITSILHIDECCKKKRKTAGKFKWMYKEDYEKYIKEKDESA